MQLTLLVGEHANRLNLLTGIQMHRQSFLYLPKHSKINKGVS